MGYWSIIMIESTTVWEITGLIESANGKNTDFPLFVRNKSNITHWFHKRHTYNFSYFSSSGVISIFVLCNHNVCLQFNVPVVHITLNLLIFLQNAERNTQFKIESNYFFHSEILIVHREISKKTAINNKT